MIKKLLVLMSALLLQACTVGLSYKPMTKDIRSSVNSLESYNLVIQDEVRPSVELSTIATKMAGGLLAGAIEASINEDISTASHTLIEPLYNVTWDMDYRKLITAELNPMLIENYNLINPKVTAETRQLSIKEIRKRVRKLKDGEALLILNSFYQLQDHFKVLQTETQARLYIANSGTSPVYSNSYFYQSEFVGAGNDDSIKKWAKNDGLLFREKLQESLNKTKHMLLYDMTPIETESCEGSAKILFPLPRLPDWKIKGAILKQTEQTLFVRSKVGNLYQVSSDKAQKIKAPHCKNGKVS